jgi:hypothetical protein
MMHVRVIPWVDSGSSRINYSLVVEHTRGLGRLGLARLLRCAPSRSIIPTSPGGGGVGCRRG